MNKLKDYALQKNYIKVLYKCFFDLHNYLLDFNVSLGFGW